MKIPTMRRLCDCNDMKANRWAACLMALLLTVGFKVAAQETNSVESAKSAEVAPAHETTNHKTPAHADGFDEASFKIVAERNIFNPSRSGGSVQRGPTRSASTRVDSFALVGTMAYEKGAFAFFEGSNSELTKVLKPNGLIAGHKVIDIFVNGVKLEYDGKEVELPVGCLMRREDQGAWHMTEASSGGSTYASRSSNGGNGNSSNGYRSDRDRDRSRGDSRSRGNREWNNNGSGNNSNGNRGNESRTAPTAAPTTGPAVDEAEVLKRLRERREKEEQ